MTTAFPTLQEQRAFWDQHWQRWQQRRVLNAWSERRFHAIACLLRTLRIKRPRILDFGCGAGFYTERLAAFGDVVGIDLSPQAISMARERRPDLVFLCASVYDPPLQPEFFDVVVSQEVVAHVDNQPRYVEQAARLLRPGGYLVLSTDNKFVMSRLGPVDWEPLPPEHIDQFLSRRALKALLRSHFRILHLTTVIPAGHEGVLKLVNSTRLAVILHRLISPATLESVKERLGFGLTMVVLAQKRSSPKRTGR